jgi:hypothetical protein
MAYLWRSKRVGYLTMTLQTRIMAGAGVPVRGSPFFPVARIPAIEHYFHGLFHFNAGASHV